MCNQQHAIHVVTQGVVLCIVSADHIMALPASPSKGNCPSHDNFLTSKRLLPPSQGDWLEKLLLNPGDGKVKLMLLWNLNRKKKENRPVDIKWKRYWRRCGDATLPKVMPTLRGRKRDIRRQAAAAVSL